MALLIMNHGSLTVSLTILALLAQYRLATMDYCTLFVIGVRIVETFLVLYFIESEVPGFDLIDKKELHDGIPFIASPALVLACCNFKLDVLITAPITLVSTWIVTKRVFDTADDNMACFKKPDTYGGI